MNELSTAPQITARIAVECRDVWKIFGPTPEQALAALRSEGLSKSEVLRRWNCVVGVAGVSFEVPSGEIFCVMACPAAASLPWSGTSKG